MPRPQELDLLRRTLGGDWDSRVEFFKKYVWTNARVRKLGSACSNLDDFLHDCMTNAMRTGHSYNAEQSLGEWVESVAAWTALDRQRMRVDGASNPPRRIRLCALVEGDESDKGTPLTSYVPPGAGSDDSLLSRIATLAGKQQFALLSKRGIEKRTWEEIATAAGQPLTTIGPTLVRSVDRLTRFFGAPPPLNADLEAVFSLVVRQDSTLKHSEREKPAGRVTAMQLDPTFYSVNPEMRKLGLGSPAEVRTIMLWDAARASTPPPDALRDHLAQCRYCADLLRALILMQEALQSVDNGEYLLCPGGFTLLSARAKAYEPLDRHLAECTLCREERTRAAGAEKGEPTRKPESNASRKTLWIGAAAALVLAGGGYFAQRQYFGAKTPAPVDAPMPIATPAPAITINPRYKDLAQHIELTDQKWAASVLPENRQDFSNMIEQLHSRKVADAKITASGLGEKDPGIQMLYSLILYQTDSPSEGFAAMLKAEAMPPRSSFRCWVTLQAALTVGDVKIIEREVQHLSTYPEYAAPAKDLLAKVRARG